MFRKNTSEVCERLTRLACCSTEPQLSVSQGLRCHVGILFRRWQSLQNFTLNLRDCYWFCSVGYDGNYLLYSSVLGWEEKCQSAVPYPTVAPFHLRHKTTGTTASQMIDYPRFNCVAPNKNRTFTETKGCSCFSPPKKPSLCFFVTVMRQVLRLHLCVFSLLFVSLLMSERQGTAPCIIFIRREKLGPTGGASRNRMRCKLKGKAPARAFR